jgi:hypothetical protein
MRVIIFFLFSFWSIQVVAQNKQFVAFMGWSGKRIELQTISNRTRQSNCTFVVGSDSIRAFVFTGPLKLMRQFSLPIKSDEKLLGGFMRDSSVYMFTEQKGKDELHCSALNVVTEKVKENFIPFDPKKEKTVTYISAGNHFLYVTASNKANELILYNFSSEQPGTALRYPFSDAQWNDLTTAGFLTRTVKLEKIDQEGDVDLDALVKNNKLYVNNESVLLVMNNHIDSTHVINFDLKQQKVSSWVIDHNPGKPAPKRISYSDNSFLFRNKLYYARATRDNLLVQIVDPYSGAIDRSFSTSSDDEISYKNTPVFQEGNSNGGKGLRDLAKTSQLLRKMIDGSAVISAKPHGNNEIEVVVGSHMNRTVNVPTPGPVTSVQPYPGSYGTMMTRQPGGFRRETWIKSTHFKMLLNADYSHLAGEPGTSINERIERYTANLKIEPESENIFVTNGQYYYAYYDKAERRLVILKF